LQPKKDRSFLEKAQSGMKEWMELMRKRESRDDTPVKPQVVARHVNDLLERSAIVTTDSGTITTWAARHIHMKRGMQFSCSGNLATMAPGLPYAIAAKAAYPDRQVVAFVGDGGFRHGGEIQLADQGGDHQEQLPGSDQVGAGSLPGQSRVRGGPGAD